VAKASSPSSASQQGSDNLNVEVCVRVRPHIAALDDKVLSSKPMSLRSLAGPAGVTVDKLQKRLLCQPLNNQEGEEGRRAFEFHQVFSEAESNEEIFERCYKESVMGALDGYSLSIFAYGQTGSGKTFTLAGDGTNGLMALGAKAVFDKIAVEGEERNTAVHFSCFEIYEEKVRDLLGENQAPIRIQSAQDKRTKQKVLHFSGLRQQQVHDEATVLSLLQVAMKGRTMGENYHHSHSSRSHTVMQLRIVSSDSEASWESSLMVVDLAGAEAAHRNSDSQRRSEGASINTSLMHLKQCVGTLARRKATEAIPPGLFRQSALTRLIEPAMTGRGHKVSVMCNVGPVTTDMRIMLDTLDFGEQAQAVQLAPEAELCRSKHEFERLQGEIERLKHEKDLCLEEVRGLAPLITQLRSEKEDLLQRLEEQADHHAKDLEDERQKGQGQLARLEQQYWQQQQDQREEEEERHQAALARFEQQREEWKAEQQMRQEEWKAEQQMRQEEWKAEQQQMQQVQEELQGELARLYQQVQETRESAMQQVQEVRECAQAEHSCMETTVRETSLAREADRQHHEEAQQQYMDELAAMAAQLDECERKAKRDSCTIESLHKEHQQRSSHGAPQLQLLQAELEGLQAKNESLQQLLEERNGQLDECNALLEERDALLEERNGQLEELRGAHRAQARHHHKELTGLEAARSECQQLQTRLLEAERQNMLLESDGFELNQSITTDKEKAASIICELESDKAALRSEIDRVLAISSCLSDNQQALLTAKEFAQTENKTLQSENSDLRGSLQRAGAKLQGEKARGDIVERELEQAKLVIQACHEWADRLRFKAVASGLPPQLASESI